MKTYLGDSVYAEIQSGQLVLTTENGLGPTNTIILEGEVYHELLRFVERESPKSGTDPMKDTVELSRTTADALTQFLNAGDFQTQETPERMGWVFFLIQHSKDDPNLFPKGKWATVQNIEGQLIEIAKAKQK